MRNSKNQAQSFAKNLFALLTCCLQFCILVNDLVKPVFGQVYSQVSCVFFLRSITPKHLILNLSLEIGSISLPHTQVLAGSKSPQTNVGGGLTRDPWTEAGRFRTERFGPSARTGPGPAKFSYLGPDQDQEKAWDWTGPGPRKFSKSWTDSDRSVNPLPWLYISLYSNSLCLTHSRIKLQCFFRHMKTTISRLDFFSCV